MSIVHFLLPFCAIVQSDFHFKQTNSELNFMANLKISFKCGGWSMPAGKSVNFFFFKFILSFERAIQWECRVCVAQVYFYYFQTVCFVVFFVCLELFFSFLFKLHSNRIDYSRARFLFCFLSNSHSHPDIYYLLKRKTIDCFNKNEMYKCLNVLYFITLVIRILWLSVYVYFFSF